MKPETVYLGLGSNLGGRGRNLSEAVEHLGKGVTIESISSVYETEPVGYPAQPRFLNAVIRGSTILGPLDLLHFIKGLERSLGRTPGFPNGPRTIDIDVLFYGDAIISTPSLTVPHPRLEERAFVLAPLAEIAPDLVHPVTRLKISQLLSEIAGKEGVKRLTSLSNSTWPLEPGTTKDENVPAPARDS